MPCYNLLTAYRLSNGEVKFTERGDVVATLQLPCGQCRGCRLERSRKWAMRCMHEASLHERNSFITLTYNDEHVPADMSLRVREWQLFAKKLRKAVGPFRFYAIGEYGPLNGRPHYHALLFGKDFEDKTYWSQGALGSKLYRSEILERVWSKGYTSVGAVTFESAAYCARYCVAKRTGPGSDLYYRRYREDGTAYQLVPEFNVMSRNPGIGKEWYKRFKSDVFPHDYVVVNGQKCKPPRFYDKLLKREDVDVYEEMKFRREVLMRGNWEEYTDARLKVREEVEIARSDRLKRTI